MSTPPPLKDWTGTPMSMFRMMGASNHSANERQHHDFYATSPEAVEQLLGLESFAPNILEPCCGQGHIARVLEQRGYKVTAQDLYDYGYGTPGVDFLNTPPLSGGLFDIITNPPYSLATEFVLHSLDILPQGHRVAMFLRLQFLEGSIRYQHLYSKGALEKVYVAAKRSHCAMNGDFANMKGNAICYAWFIWRKGYKGAATIDWFNTPPVTNTKQQEFAI